MAKKSCHSNQSSYPIGTKTNIICSPVPIDAECEIWQESGSWLQRIYRLKMLTLMMDDERTTDACLYYMLTYEPLAQVS